MLAQLSIRDIVLIEKLDLPLTAGLSVLTGETGAGKSILLDALSLALGARGDGSLVRLGATQGQVTAMFEPEAGHPVWAVLNEQMIESDGTVVMRRVQAADGRTRGFVNDTPVSATVMREIGNLMVEIHGQHDERALVNPSAHRRLLDAFGGLDVDAALVSAAWNQMRKAKAELRQLADDLERDAREADYLCASVDELTRLAPESGEEEELAARRSMMMKSEKIATEINEAHEALNGTASPAPGLSSLMRRLERKSGEAPGLLDETIAALGGALDQLYLAQQAVELALRRTEYDPHELERAEERLFALRAAARKFSVSCDELGPLGVRMAEALARYTAGSETRASLETKVVALQGEYDRLASALSRKRRDAAVALQNAVEAELPALKLENAGFIVGVDEGEDGPEGRDQVEFRVRTNPGAKPGPIMKVASGGELSRFLLALKVALADRGSAPTLIFDEIDSGVGGAVADAIGRRLKRLASRVQVVSVTHAPQVAALAHDHWLISKRGREARGDVSVVTHVKVLDEGERREEIARMLAGERITDEARAAAEKLIAHAAA